MKISKAANRTCVIAMSVLISHAPNVAVAEKLTSDKMITAGEVLADISRQEAEENVSSYLQRADVQAELLKQGVSADEAASRLVSLSDSEVKQLALQAKKAQAGGDILVAVLLVVLIIYFAKRI